MTFGHPIQLRLSPEKQRVYEEAAARQGKPFSSYLRERLEASVSLDEELSALRQDVASLRLCVDSLAHGATSTDSTPLLLEILLMLRAIGGPERTRTIRAELERLGMDLWTPDGGQSDAPR